jgi:hypothetical protein
VVVRATVNAKRPDFKPFSFKSQTYAPLDLGLWTTKRKPLDKNHKRRG